MQRSFFGVTDSIGLGTGGMASRPDPPCAVTAAGDRRRAATDDVPQSPRGSCHQQDVDEWLATGPTTRHKIRAFFAWAKKSKINTAVRLENEQPQTIRLLTQDQRLAWIRRLLTGDTESLPHRVAGTLVLLYAQPMVKIAALKTTAIDITPHETLISLGAEPIPVPEPVAGMLKVHLDNRPNLRTGGGRATTAWLFPGRGPGKHLDTETMVKALGISVLAARTSALRDLVAEIPPPVVAQLLGYSHNCTQYHAEQAGQRWCRYVTHSGKSGHALATQDNKTPNFPIRCAALEASTRVAAAIVHSAISPVKCCKLRVFRLRCHSTGLGGFFTFPVVPTGP